MGAGSGIRSLLTYYITYRTYLPGTLLALLGLTKCTVHPKSKMGGQKAVWDTTHVDVGQLLGIAVLC